MADEEDTTPAGWTPSPPPTRSSRHSGGPYAEVPVAALVVGALWGVGVLLVAAFFLGLDYFAVRGATTEHAVVVSVAPSGTKETCGVKALFPDTPGERTTYRSSDPPRGLPAEFTQTHCPDDGDELGARVLVRRTGTGEDDVYVEPIESAAEWLGASGLAGVAAFVIAAVLGGAKEAWSAHRSVRRIRRRAARERDQPAEHS